MSSRDSGAPVLAIDIGSTTVKAARFSLEGEQVGAVVEHRHRSGASAALDLDRVLESVFAVMTGLDLKGVRAVATTTVWQTALLLSSDGSLRREPATWETSHPAAVMRRVANGVSESWDQDVTGAYIHSGYPLLVVATDPLTTSDDRIQDVGSWLVERLTGAPVGWSEPVAAGSGLWDQRHRRWSRIADDLEIRPHLERATLFAAAVTPVDPHDSLPAELRSALWLPPLPDGLCHNLGVGAVDDVIAVTVGTSGSVRAVRNGAPDGRITGLWHYRCGPDTHALGGAVSTAGNLLEWVHHLSGRPVTWAWTEHETPQLPTVRAVPDVYGRRGPDYPLDATGALHGLRPHHTLADVSDALAIDMWSNFAGLYRLLSQVHPVVDVRAGGGVIERSPQTAQLLADALGVTVTVAAASQPALRGAALVASAHLCPVDGMSAIDQAVSHIRSQQTESPALARSVEPRGAWAAALTARWSSSGDHVDPPLSTLFSNMEEDR